MLQQEPPLYYAVSLRSPPNEALRGTFYFTAIKAILEGNSDLKKYNVLIIGI